MKKAPVKETTETNPTHTLMKTVMEWAKVIVIAFIIAFAISRLITTSVVIGTSMYPTLKPGNYLLVNRTAYWFTTPHFDDIIITHSDLPGNIILIKRIIGVPGDRLIIQDNHVWINGKELNEPYIHGEPTSGHVNEIIPSGKYFVMGDNRIVSLDSRYPQVGLIPKSEIIGKVMLRLFPFIPISNK